METSTRTISTNARASFVVAGPDGTIGFASRTKKKSKKKKKKKKKKAREMEEGKRANRRRHAPSAKPAVTNMSIEDRLFREEETRLNAVRPLLMSLSYLTFRRQCLIGSSLSRRCAEHYTLYIRRVSIRRRNMSRALTGEVLSRVIPRCYNLESLNLSGQNLREHAIPVLEALPCCRNLRSLNLYANHIGDDGAVALAGVLRHCARVEEVCLRWNEICEDGAVPLLRALERCEKLEFVDVTFNGFDSTSADIVPYVEALRRRGDDGEENKGGGLRGVVVMCE